MRGMACSTQHILSTVLIVEDHDIVRANLYDWLSVAFADHDFLVARGGEEALELAAAHSPKLVLIDIGLLQIEGIETAGRIKAAAPRTQLVILSIHEEPDYQAAAAAAGACAYVCKRRLHSDLLPALSRLLG